MLNPLKSLALAAALAMPLAASAPAWADHHTSAAKATTTTPAPAAKPAPDAPGTRSPAAKLAPKAISVDALAVLLKAQLKEPKRELLAVLDVNSPQTRAEQGLIPGAVMLDSSSAYDLSLLGKDKELPLVFYCSNEKCSASKTAALRALDAGFTDVSVLPVGIHGWAKAGQAVDKPVG